MKTSAIFVAAVTALAGNASAAICASNRLICGFELRNLGFTQTELEGFVSASQAPPTQENVDGLYQCNGADVNPLWLHACNGANGLPTQGQCLGANSQFPGSPSACRFGP